MGSILKSTTAVALGYAVAAAGTGLWMDAGLRASVQRHTEQALRLAGSEVAARLAGGGEVAVQARRAAAAGAGDALEVSDVAVVSAANEMRFRNGRGTLPAFHIAAVPATPGLYRVSVPLPGAVYPPRDVRITFTDGPLQDWLHGLRRRLALGLLAGGAFTVGLLQVRRPRERRAPDTSAIAERAVQGLERVLRAEHAGWVLIDADARVQAMGETAVELLGGAESDVHWRRLVPHVRRAIGGSRAAGRAILDADVTHRALPARLHMELHALDATRQNWLVVIGERASHEALEADLSAATRQRALAQLHAGTAHDLRAPLNAMVVNLELLRQSVAQPEGDGEQAARRRSYVTVLAEQLNRLSARVQALLHSLEPVGETSEPIDLAALLAELQSSIASQARVQQVALDWDLPPVGPQLMGSAVALRQALLNVLVNALQAMPQGGHLGVRLARLPQHAEVEVLDTGPGIEPRLRERIFERYYSTRADGTGSGLYVARRVIERHGGSIEARAVPAGACFSVRLPCALESGAAELEAAVAPASGADD